MRGVEQDTHPPVALLEHVGQRFGATVALDKLGTEQELARWKTEYNKKQCAKHPRSSDGRPDRP